MNQVSSNFEFEQRSLAENYLKMELKSFLAISLALAVFAVCQETEGEDIRSRFSLKVSQIFQVYFSDFGRFVMLSTFGPFSSDVL